MKIGLLISPVLKWKNVISLIKYVTLFLKNEQLKFPVYRLSTDFFRPAANIFTEKWEYSVLLPYSISDAAEAWTTHMGNS